MPDLVIDIPGTPIDVDEVSTAHLGTKRWGRQKCVPGVGGTLLIVQREKRYCFHRERPYNRTRN